MPRAVAWQEWMGIGTASLVVHVLLIGWIAFSGDSSGRTSRSCGISFGTITAIPLAYLWFGMWTGRLITGFNLLLGLGLGAFHLVVWFVLGVYVCVGWTTQSKQPTRVDAHFALLLGASSVSAWAWLPVILAAVAGV